MFRLHFRVSFYRAIFGLVPKTNKLKVPVVFCSSVVLSLVNVAFGGCASHPKCVCSYCVGVIFFLRASTHNYFQRGAVCGVVLSLSGGLVLHGREYEYCSLNDRIV
jgi:hypothetical protein